MLIAIWHFVPAIRTGNTVVVKPSPHTPLSTIRLVEILNEVLPPGVLNVVAGRDDLGQMMTEHPDIQKIVFTGSCATGKKVMQAASGTLKRVTLELGGNDAGIVLPDADPKEIAERLFWGAFINNGQTCAALKRLYVPDEIYDEVCDALVDYARTGPGRPRPRRTATSSARSRTRCSTTRSSTWSRTPSATARASCAAAKRLTVPASSIR